MSAPELASLEKSYSDLCTRVGLVPTRGRGDLAHLDAMLAASMLSAAKRTDVLMAGIALGIVISSELGLNWIHAELDGGLIGIEGTEHREFALQYRNDPCFVFPISMVQKRVFGPKLDLSLIQMFERVRASIETDEEYRRLASAEGESPGGTLIS